MTLNAGSSWNLSCQRPPSYKLRTLRELQLGILEGRSWTTNRNGRQWGREERCENLSGLIELIYGALAGDSRVTVGNAAEEMFDRYGVDYLLFAHPLGGSALLPQSLQSTLVTYLSRKAGKLPVDGKSLKSAEESGFEGFSVDYRRARCLLLVASLIDRGALTDDLLGEVYVGITSMWVSLDEERQEPIQAVRELLSSLARIGKINSLCDIVRFLKDENPQWEEELLFLLELAGKAKEG